LGRPIFTSEFLHEPNGLARNVKFREKRPQD
jgi:hypothetical protein